MKLYDTSKSGYQTFKPHKKEVSIYVCGITPYDAAHIGHIFTFLTYDLLTRHLQRKGYRVRIVRNITDVDEPLFDKAAELDLHYLDLANRQIKMFHKTLKKLNFLDVFAEPRASEYIPDMAKAVKQLFDNGFGYYVEKDMYFDTSKQPEFGNFCGYNDQLQYNLFAERGGDPERRAKRHPLDFLLWRHVSRDAVGSWTTILGDGRPGWHIECSVMSSKLLGNTFDIHGGGTDLIFPHHECEIAQSRALSGGISANLWLHVSPLLLAGEKMSKSLGNMEFANKLLETHAPAHIRLALMHYHHRIGGEWRIELLDEAAHLYNNLLDAATRCTQQQADVLLHDVVLALDDNINTLEVIDAIHVFIKSVNNSEQQRKQIPAPVQITFQLLGISPK